MRENDYDAIIIGAGLGGMLSAAQLLQRDKRVIVVERLPHCGGRFTAKTFQGVQVSTGAVHMIPFGSSGVLARMLRRLRVPHHFFDADVFASFHVRGKQIRSRGILGTLKVFGPRQFFWFARVGYLMFFHRLPASERTLPFDQWLACHIDVQRNPELRAFFEQRAADAAPARARLRRVRVAAKRARCVIAVRSYAAGRPPGLRSLDALYPQA